MPFGMQHPGMVPMPGMMPHAAAMQGMQGMMVMPQAMMAAQMMGGMPGMPGMQGMQGIPMGYLPPGAACLPDTSLASGDVSCLAVRQDACCSCCLTHSDSSKLWPGRQSQHRGPRHAEDLGVGCTLPASQAGCMLHLLPQHLGSHS